MASAPWLRRYQIVQTEPDFIRVQMVSLREANPAPKALAEVGRALLAALEEPIHVDVKLVSEIPPAKNGKFRPYYSMVSDAKASSPSPDRQGAIRVGGQLHR